MRARFRGKLYRVKLLPTWRGRSETEQGYCTPPMHPGREIVLRRGMPRSKRLENAIHEALHACQWDLDDSVVYEIAHDLARYLPRLFEITAKPEIW